MIGQLQLAFHRVPSLVVLVCCLGISAGAMADPVADLARGRELQKAGNCGDAISYLLRAARSGEGYAEAYLLLGLCYEELGRAENAVWAYGQVSGDKRYGAEAIYYMAQLYLGGKKYLEAARIFLSVAKHHPRSNWAAPALERAGWCFQKAEKRRRAYEVYLEALEMVERKDLRRDIKKRIKDMGYYVPDGSVEGQ